MNIVDNSIQKVIGLSITFNPRVTSLAHCTRLRRVSWIHEGSRTIKTQVIAVQIK